MARTLFAAALVAVAACGSSGPNDQPIGPCPANVSGCTSFVDLTADDPAVIQFGGANGFAFVPPCARVKVGQSIQFQGDFGLHPLSEVCGPIDAIPHTTSGTSVTFSLATAGTYGYVCDVHSGVGMDGALDVVP